MIIFNNDPPVSNIQSCTLCEQSSEEENWILLFSVIHTWTIIEFLISVLSLWLDQESMESMESELLVFVFVVVVLWCFAAIWRWTQV